MSVCVCVWARVCERERESEREERVRVRERFVKETKGEVVGAMGGMHAREVDTDSGREKWRGR